MANDAQQKIANHRAPFWVHCQCHVLSSSFRCLLSHPDAEQCDFRRALNMHNNNNKTSVVYEKAIIIYCWCCAIAPDASADTTIGFSYITALTMWVHSVSHSPALARSLIPTLDEWVDRSAINMDGDAMRRRDNADSHRQINWIKFPDFYPPNRCSATKCG